MIGSPPTPAESEIASLNNFLLIILCFLKLFFNWYITIIHMQLQFKVLNELFNLSYFQNFNQFGRYKLSKILYWHISNILIKQFDLQVWIKTSVILTLPIELWIKRCNFDLHKHAIRHLKCHLILKRTSINIYSIIQPN